MVNLLQVLKPALGDAKGLTLVSVGGKGANTSRIAVFLFCFFDCHGPSGKCDRTAEYEHF